MVKCFSVGVAVCYNIINSPDHLWAILRLHVRLGEIWTYCTTRLLWGHLPAFFCWLVRVCARNWGRICHPKQSHGAIRNNIDPVASGPSLATFTFPVTQFVFPAKFCTNVVFNFVLGVTIVPWEFENKTYAKFCGVEKLLYGERESSHCLFFTFLPPFRLPAVQALILFNIDCCLNFFQRFSKCLRTRKSRWLNTKRCWRKQER